MKQASRLVKEDKKTPDIGLRTLEYPETYSAELQSKIIDRAEQTPGEVLFDALPEALKRVSLYLSPPLLIPSKEFLVRSPLSTVNFFNSLEKHIPTGSLADDSMQILASYKQISLHIGTLSRECRKGRYSLNRHEKNSKLASLDQSAQMLALIAPVLRDIFQTIPIPEAYLALPAPKTIISQSEEEKVDPEKGSKLDKSSMSELLKALLEDDKMPESIEAQNRKHKVSQIQKNLFKSRSHSVFKPDKFSDAWNNLPKSVKIIGGVTGASAILGWAAANDSLPIVIGGMVVLGLLGAASELLKSAKNAGNVSEGDTPTNIPARKVSKGSSSNNKPFSMGSERSKKQTLPEPKTNSKPSDPKKGESTQKSNAQDGTRMPLGEHAKRRDVDINTSSSNLNSAGLIGEMEQGELFTGAFKTQDANFTSVMCVAEPYIVIGANGKMESIRSWRNALPPELQEEFSKGLFISKTFESLEREENLNEGETELEFEFSVTNASLPTPANYQVIDLAVFDQTGTLVEGDFEVEMCILGSATIKLPRPGLTVKYKLAEVSNWELQSDSINELIPKTSIEAGFTVDSMIDALNSVESTSTEKAVLWFDWLTENDFRYSNDFLVGNLLRRSGDNLSEALLGLRIATCDPMAFVTAASLGNLNIPSFVIGGLVPKVRKDGTFSFNGESGHAQAAAFLDSQVFTFDLTSESSKVSYDPLLIPATDRSLLLSRISSGSGQESYEAGVEARGKLLKLRNKEEKGIRGFAIEIERRVRSMFNGETIPGVPEIPASGHNFRNRLPSVSDSKKKIGALNFVGYFNRLTALCREGKDHRDVLAPLYFYERMTFPTYVVGMEKFLPEKFQKIAFEGRETARKIVFEYIESSLNSQTLFDSSRSAVIKWTIDFISNNRKDFSLKHSLEYSSLSQLDIAELCALHQKLTPYMENTDYKKFTFLILQDFLRRNNVTLEYGASPSNFPKEDRDSIEYLIGALGEDLEERNIKFTAAEQKELTLVTAWIGRSLDHHNQKQDTHKVQAAKTIRSISGKGEASAKAFMVVLQDKDQGFSGEFERFLREVGVTSTYDFASNPQLKKTVEEELGQRIVADLMKLELSAWNIMKWKNDIDKFNSFGLVPDLSASKKSLYVYIANKSESLSKTSVYFNYPSDETPGSSLMAALTNRDCAHFIDAIKYLHANTKGSSEKDIVTSWHPIDEYKVTREFLQLATFDEGYDYVSLSLSGYGPLTNDRLVVSDDPRLVRQFFLRADSSGYLREMDPLGEFLIERLNLAPKTDELTKVFYKIEQKYPDLWTQVVPHEARQSRLPYGYHTNIVLQTLLGNLLVDVDHSELYAGFVWYVENKIFKSQNQDLKEQIEGLKVLLLTDGFEHQMPFGKKISKEALEAGALIAIAMQTNNRYELDDWIKTNFGFNDALFHWRYKNLDSTMAAVWRDMFSHKASPDSRELNNDLISRKFKDVQKEVDWIYSRVASPYAEYLFAHTGHVVTPSQGGDFDEFRPFAEGDDLRKVDWLNSARSPTLLVKNYTEDEARHLNLIYDARVLWKAFTDPDSPSGKVISDLIMHMIIAHRENMKIDLVIQGRNVLAHFKDLHLPHNSGNTMPFFRTKKFWSDLFETIDLTDGVYQTEQNLFEENEVGYDIFRNEQPNLQKGRLNYFVLDRENLNRSSDFLHSLERHGELVEIDRKTLENIGR